MSKKKYKLEDTISALHQVDVLHSRGTTVAEAMRHVGMTLVTYQRWRKEYGGLQVDQLKRLKEPA